MIAIENPAETSVSPRWHHTYVMPIVLRELRKLPGRNLIDIGCGDGRGTACLAKQGYEVCGVDCWESEIASARRNFPTIKFECASGCDDLVAKFGRFPIVTAVEVISHLSDPRAFMHSAFDLLEPGGSLLVTTPFHGYWKNLALAVAGKWESHANPLHDQGFIKLWSIATLTALFQEFNLELVGIERVGRIPALAKSMVAVARKSNS